MSYTLFTINRGINRPIELWGLKAQYAIILAAGLIAMLVTFALLFIAHTPTYICFAVALPVVGALLKVTRRLSNRYGQHGLMKKYASNRIPKVIRSTSRGVFFANRQTNKNPDA